MKLAVFSHKLIWENPDFPSGYATDGGFGFQMKAISEIFEETILVVPVAKKREAKGEVPIEGHNLRVHPLNDIKGGALLRKLGIPFFLLRNISPFISIIRNADVIHMPIPGDIGLLGMLIAKMMNKPLFVRYCGNWLAIETVTGKFIKWFFEKYASGKNVFLATGVENTPPSQKNPNIKWIFSSSLTRAELSELSKNRPILDPKMPRLIIACRQEFGKGTGEVIKALALLKNEFPTMLLDVVGDGGALNSYKETAKNEDVMDRVIFHGKVDHDNVLRLMQQAQVFCFPSHSEGFPKVVLEALASGLPVLGTPVSAVRYLLSGGGGIILEDRSAQTLANAIREVVQDPENYRRLQEKAIATAQNFTLENWRDTIRQHLENALGEKI
jgi:glycosyltransferase involved in cell wall biosynthesis